MLRYRYFIGFMFVVVMAASGVLQLSYGQTPGTAKSHQKVSDTDGNFTGVLDDSDQFGQSVANLGDLNGDGVPDLAVGARDDDDGGNARGAVWILFMNSNGTVAGHQKISDTVGGFTGTLDDGDQIGFDLTSPGDIDGDGIADLAAGAPGDDDGGSARGAVWVLFMNNDGTVKTHQKISDTEGAFAGTLGNDNFGSAVASPGDLDGDGVVDLVVGSPFDDDGNNDRGAVWVLFMNSDGTVKSHQKISDITGSFTGTLDDSDQFGHAVASIGDLDGDGISDLAVGAREDDDGGNARGAVWVLFMNSDGTVKSHQKISDTDGNFTGALDDGDVFGFDVAAGGDLDGDSIADLVVGAAGDDDGGNARGAVWVLFMNSDGTVKSHQKISDTDGNFTGVLNDNDNFGSAVTSVGDINNDNFPDLAVGVPFNDDGGSDRGAVWVLTLNGQASSSSPIQLSLSTAFAAPGDTVKLDLKLDNSSSSAVGGLQAQIYLGDMAKATFTGLADTLMGNAGGFTVTTTVVGDTLKVVVFSTDNSALNPGTHILGRLCFALIDNNGNLSSETAITIDANTLEIGDDQGQLLTDNTTDGAIQIGIRGDVNLDARVSILDVIKLVRIIIGSDPTPTAGSAAFAIADMNEDGTLNIADVVAQINNILGIAPKAVASTPTQPVTVSLDPLRTLPDGRSVLPVTFGTDGLIAGTQLAFTFDPALIEIGAPQLAETAENLGFDYHIEDGTLRLVVFGMQPGTGIPAGQDIMLYLPVSLLGNAAAAPSVTLTEALLVDAQAHTVPVQFGGIAQPVIGRNAAVPGSFSLAEATPNPFNPSTTISYDVPQQAHVTLTVYNLLGQEVVRLVDQVQQAGQYQVTWQAINSRGASVASGVYLYRLTSDTGHSESRRMTLLK